MLFLFLYSQINNIMKSFTIALLFGLLFLVAPAQDANASCGDDYAECLSDALDSPANSQLVVRKKVCDYEFIFCRVGEST